MPDTIIIYGPKACGKTRNAEAISAYFDGAEIIDNWHLKLPLKVGAIHLISATVEELFKGRHRICGKEIVVYAFETIHRKIKERAQMLPTQTELETLARDIHADNVTAGWWTNIKTAESTLTTRNRPEMLMLAVSEIAEAAEGWDGDLFDDKLTHHRMTDVEIADFVIRQLDQIGAEISLGHKAPIFYPFEADVPLGFNAQMMKLVRMTAAAMEHFRKGRVDSYISCMADGVMWAFKIANHRRIPLMEIIAEKRAFNKVREDHKPENRAKEGGKAF